MTTFFDEVDEASWDNIVNPLNVDWIGMEIEWKAQCELEWDMESFTTVLLCLKRLQIILPKDMRNYIYTMLRNVPFPLVENG